MRARLYLSNKIDVAMNKLNVIYPCLVGFCFALLVFNSCKPKDYSCTMKITCQYFDGVDSGKAVKGAHVVVGRERYANGPSADYARAEGTTDENGVFVHVFDFPALLDVVVTHHDSIPNADSTSYEVKYYTGNAQVQLYESEMTHKVIQMIETEELN